jgi:hypothetical protein
MRENEFHFEDALPLSGRPGAADVQHPRAQVHREQRRDAQRERGREPAAARGV